ncbi:chorismate mutase [Acidithiobacillus sp.]|uniref:chorismate mutase n=1 Tax=Acidithiobacillus sp. TaxID=1872118 RepID=UPI003CFED590
MTERFHSIAEIRSGIDQVDREIVALLAQRGRLVHQAARFKKTADDVKAPQRVKQVIARVKTLAEEMGADPSVVERVYRTMISAFIDAELAEHALLADNTTPDRPDQRQEYASEDASIKPPLPAQSVPPSAKKTNYPPPFADLVEGRMKRKLGDHFGLSHFGVNLTQLAPGAISALFHHHSRQDEFIYVLQGTLTLVLGEKEYQLRPGDCAGFPPGAGVPHHLVNRSGEEALYLEIGDRSVGDVVEYPHDDLKAMQLADGKWVFTHRDGQSY